VLEVLDGNVPLPQTLFAPQLLYPFQPEDNDFSPTCRIGRSVYLHGITVRGEIFRVHSLQSSESVGAFNSPGVIRVLLVADKHSNQLQLTTDGISPDPTASMVLDDSNFFNSSGIRQYYQFGPQLYAPKDNSQRERVLFLDEVFVRCRPGAPIMRQLPTTLEVGLDTTSTATTALSGTADGTVGLTAGTGGPIALVIASESTTDTVAATTGTVSGVILPDFIVPGFSEPFELNYFFKEPLRVDFDIMYTGLPNKSTGTILDCPSLSFHIVGGRETYPLGAQITYYSRCWFTDL